MITKQTLIADLLQQENADELAVILQNSGMHCLHCAMAHGESIEEAAVVHGLDVDELLAQLNSVK